MGAFTDAGDDVLVGKLGSRPLQDTVGQQVVAHGHGNLRVRSTLARRGGYGCLMLTPPSMAQVCPVTYDAAGDARYTAR